MKFLAITALVGKKRKRSSSSSTSALARRRPREAIRREIIASAVRNARVPLLSSRRRRRRSPGLSQTARRFLARPRFLVFSASAPFRVRTSHGVPSPFTRKSGPVRPRPPVFFSSSVPSPSSSSSSLVARLFRATSIGRTVLRPVRPIPACAVRFSQVLSRCRRTERK